MLYLIGIENQEQNGTSGTICSLRFLGIEPHISERSKSILIGMNYNK